MMKKKKAKKKATFSKYGESDWESWLYILFSLVLVLIEYLLTGHNARVIHVKYLFWIRTMIFSLYEIVIKNIKKKWKLTRYGQSMSVVKKWVYINNDNNNTRRYTGILKQRQAKIRTKVKLKFKKVS